MIRIITHPNNLKHFRQIKEEAYIRLSSQGMTTIKGTLYDIPITTSIDMPESYISEYKGKEEKLLQHGTSDWEMYFGFVNPVYKPLFRFYEDRGYAIYKP